MFKSRKIVKINPRKVERFEELKETENNNEILNEEISTNKEKKKNPLIRVIKLLIWIGIIILIFIYNGYSNFKTETLIENKTIIEITKGDTLNSLSEKLEINKNYLKFYIKNNNPDFSLIVGNFEIQENSDIESILESLKTPIIEDEITITTLEGWNIFDIDYYLSNKGLIEKGEYITYVTNQDKIEQLTEFFPFIKGLETLEGFLYPDTYNVLGNNFKINVFVIKQLENFEIKVYNKILGELNNEEIENLINLASIVEKEEKNSNEKATVAGILKKRLENGWMIGADITVCYPHNLTSEECKMVVSKYINEKSDYNTRTMTGLPKTPIGNPSFETIEASLNYNETKYWFYLHNISSGKIYYAETNAEHEYNKKYMY